MGSSSVSRRSGAGGRPEICVLLARRRKRCKANRGGRGPGPSRIRRTAPPVLCSARDDPARPIPPGETIMFDDSKRLDKLEAQMAGVEKSIAELRSALDGLSKSSGEKF